MFDPITHEWRFSAPESKREGVLEKPAVLMALPKPITSIPSTKPAAIFTSSVPLTPSAKAAPDAKAASDANLSSRLAADDLGSSDTGASTPTAIAKLERDLADSARSLVDSTQTGCGVGIDVESISSWSLSGADAKSSDFLRRNFTDAELTYCRTLSADGAASLAARWCAKEAVIKAMSSASHGRSNVWRGAGAPLKNIEIVQSASGAPTVVLHGYARQVATALAIEDGDIALSISHSADTAIAQAVVLPRSQLRKLQK